MGYRNKTYVIFDGDNDMWAYGFMKGWNTQEHIDFDFHDAHDLNELRDNSSEETVKRKLRERLANTKQAIVLIGENTKNLYRYVRWEIETCLDNGVAIVAVNLNNNRRMDSSLCPAILDGKGAVHVPFKLAIIKHALDDFCANYARHKLRDGEKKNYYYEEDLYKKLGII